MRPRLILLALVTLALTIAAAGCVAPGPAVPTDTLVVGLDGNRWDSLDPFLAKDHATRDMLANIFEPLLRPDPSGQLAPVLAEKWQQVDPVTWEFTLRSGVVFQDRTPLTPDDVVFSIQRAKETGSQGVFGSTLDPVVSVTATGPVIRIVTDKPDPLLPAALAQVPVVSEKHYQSGAAPSPIGTGPFQLSSYTATTAELQRWNGYWNDTGLAPSDVRRVIFKLIPDAAAREAGLQQGTLQIIQGVPPQDAAGLKNRGLQLLTVPGTMMYMMELNTMKAPLDRPEARRALNYAIDYDEVIQKLYGGLGVRLAGPLVPGSLGETAQRAPYPHDPNLARSLWAQAGGTGTVLVIDTLPEREEEAKLIVDMLAAAGIEARVQVWSSPSDLRQAIAAGDRMAYLTQWGEASLDPYEVLVPKIRTGGLYNFSFFANREVDDLIDEATVSTDQSHRATLYAQAEGQIIQDTPWVFGYVLTACEAAAPDVKGYQARRDGLVILAGVSRQAPH